MMQAQSNYQSRGVLASILGGAFQDIQTNLKCSRTLNDFPFTNSVNTK